MAGFPNTRLSVIERIRIGDAEARREALEVFIQAYRPALVAFLIKAKQLNPTDADDLVNEFILHRIMTGRVLELASDNGRFRHALRTCIQRYLIDSIRKRSREPISPDADLDQVPIAESTTEGIEPLDRVWAVATFTNALCQMKCESDHWELFVGRVLTEPAIQYGAIIAELGYQNPQKASNALMTAKRTFNRILSACLESQTSLAPSASGAEIADEAKLLRILLSDTEAVRESIESMVDRPPTSVLLSRPGAIETSHTFVDLSADAHWGIEDAKSMFADLLDQPVCEMCSVGLEDDGVGQISLREIFDINSSAHQRVDLLSLKEHFNSRGKLGGGDLPQRLNVAITFALICRHVLAQGRVAQITSMTELQVSERVQHMSLKSWVPPEVRTLFASTVHYLTPDAK